MFDKALNHDWKSSAIIEQKKIDIGFRAKLEEIDDVIHPTEIFDMCAGTSTGSLIAFALVQLYLAELKADSSHLPYEL